MGDRRDLFKTWVVLWSTYCLMDVWQQDFHWASGWWRWSTAAAAAVSLLVPSVPPLLCAILLRNGNRLVMMPFVWDSDQWAMFLDLAVVRGVSRSWQGRGLDVERVVEETAPLVRVLLGVFYFAAGFWKANSSFLDPHVSCGGIFTTSLVWQLWPEGLWGPVPDAVARGAVLVGPWMTMLGECLAGLLLLAGARSSAANVCGLCSLIMLHLAISYTVYPNGIANFSYCAATRYFFLVPRSCAAALREFASPDDRRSGWLVRGAAVAVLAVAWHAGKISGPQHAGTVFYTVQAMLFSRAACLEVRALRGSRAKGSPPSRRLGASGWLCLLAALFAAFGTQVLGLADLCSTASPFSHIRVHGAGNRGNHLLLPTGLLLEWASRASSHLPPEHSLAGGVVRVEHTDSVYFNSLFPGESTEELPPEVTALLRRGGHLAREFSPTPRRVLGYEISRFLPRWSPGGAPFLQYTIPAMELRRVFAEARAHGETFRLRYVRLPHGGLGTDSWRASAQGPRVEVLVNASTGGVECTLDSGEPCAEDELVSLPGLDFLSLKTRTFFPYPIIDGLDELPCID